MGYIVASVNMKGGVGKTTLTVNIAACLAQKFKKRVLVVDLDTQISATLSMISPGNFAKLKKERLTLRQLVYQAIQPEEQKAIIQRIIRTSVCNVQGLDLLVGDIDLYDEFLVSEMLYRKAIDSETNDFEQVWNSFEKTLVKRILDPVVKSYDFIILDCAPGYNLLTRSSIIASDFYLIPAKPEPLSVVGIQLLERRIEQLRKSYQADKSVHIKLLGIAFTMSANLYLGRYYKQVMKRVDADFGGSKVFNTRIPSDVNIAKAVDSFTPIVLSDPTSQGAKAFTSLTEEFLQKLEPFIGIDAQSMKLNLLDLEES